MSRRRPNGWAEARRARAVHLKYHLSMRNILTPTQVEVYEALGSPVEPAAGPAAPADAGGRRHH